MSDRESLSTCISLTYLCHNEGIKGDWTSFTDTSWETFNKAAELRHNDVRMQMYQ